MILAWVIALILLCSSLLAHLEKLNGLRIVEVQTIQASQKHFIAAENAVTHCEGSITSIVDLKEHACIIQSAGKNRWFISSKDKPVIQIGVMIDEKTGAATRVNWRQVFE